MINGSEMIEEVMRKVKTTQAKYHQKSYNDSNHMVEFQVDEYVFLIISLVGGVTHFGKIGKLKL